jgi:hypothetical protein
MRSTAAATPDMHSCRDRLVGEAPWLGAVVGGETSYALGP